MGKTIVVLGSSGSGKSTLLRCLNLLELPDSGKLTINDQNINYQDDEHNILRQQIGMVFQNFNLFKHMTVLENITYAPSKIKQLPEKDNAEAALNLLKKVGLSDKLNVYPSQLSGGQKQRVAIARALMMNPKVLLFDEPTSALDPEMVGEVLKVIRELSHKKLGIVIVSHEMQFAKMIADEIWFLDQGKIIEKSMPDKFFSAPQTKRAQEFLLKMNHRFGL